MNRRIFKYLLIFSAVIAAKAKGESKFLQQSRVYKNIFGPSSYDGRDNGRLPYFYFLGSYNNGQILRSQSQRTVNVLKNAAICLNKFNAYFKFLSYNFPQTSVGYVRSAKLILFPFHVFW